MTVDHLASISQIILIDLVLSGDNAVVIALAAHLLPLHQRRQAMLWGCGLAITMRLMLTLVVSNLLLLPGLRFVGALLLAWIACKLIVEKAESVDQTRPPPNNLLKAISRIAMADFIMSLDNVVAIAGVSKSDPVRLTFGLLLSIAMIMTLSTVIMEIMDRYRWIAYLGTAVLALTAAEMISHDLELLHATALGKKDYTGFPTWANWTVRFTLLGSCLTANWWWPKRLVEQVTAQPTESHLR
jgi:YjbE family integral membrane protein